MPVRFRCTYCNQLLGISRRKIGTAVRCPTCAGQVVVPQLDTEPAARPVAARRDAAKPPMFEASDFDNLFNPAGIPKPARQPVAQPAAEPFRLDVAPQPQKEPLALASEPMIDVEQMLAPADLMPVVKNGIVLTPLKATVLTVVVILLLALAFGAGLWVGRSLGT